MLIGLLSLALMVYAQHRFVGYLVVILVFVAQTVLGLLNYDHNLYNFAGTPGTPYSAMNGWGHYLTGWAWFSGYWALFTLMLLWLAAALWTRGQVATWRERLRLAGRQLRGPLGVALALTGVAWAGSGAWIGYNTNVLNTYRPGDEAFDLQARYEREYAQYQDLAQPRIRAVRADVDLRPETHQATIRGEYRLHNPHAAPIAELHIVLPEQIELTELRLPGAIPYASLHPMAQRPLALHRRTRHPWAQRRKRCHRQRCHHSRGRTLLSRPVPHRVYLVQVRLRRVRHADESLRLVVPVRRRLSGKASRLHLTHPVPIPELRDGQLNADLSTCESAVASGQLADIPRDRDECQTAGL